MNWQSRYASVISWGQRYASGADLDEIAQKHHDETQDTIFGILNAEEGTSEIKKTHAETFKRRHDNDWGSICPSCKNNPIVTEERPEPPGTYKLNDPESEVHWDNRSYHKAMICKNHPDRKFHSKNPFDRTIFPDEPCCGYKNLRLVGKQPPPHSSRGEEKCGFCGRKNELVSEGDMWHEAKYTDNLRALRGKFNPESQEYERRHPITGELTNVKTRCLLGDKKGCLGEAKHLYWRSFFNNSENNICDTCDKPKDHPIHDRESGDEPW